MTSTAPKMLMRGIALALMAGGLTTGMAAPGDASAREGDRPLPVSERAGTAAGTLVYISGHNVWIARGDGSGARPLTTDGSFAAPYGSPTQSDSGTIVATRSQRLVRLNQVGPGPQPPRPTSSAHLVGVAIDGTPVNAAISPDGTRIAYTFTKYLTPVGASSGFRSATGSIAESVRLNTTARARSPTLGPCRLAAAPPRTPGVVDVGWRAWSTT